MALEKQLQSMKEDLKALNNRKNEIYCKMSCDSLKRGSASPVCTSLD